MGFQSLYRPFMKYKLYQEETPLQTGITLHSRQASPYDSKLKNIRLYQMCHFVSIFVHLKKKIIIFSGTDWRYDNLVLVS